MHLVHVNKALCIHDNLHNHQTLNCFPSMQSDGRRSFLLSSIILVVFHSGQHALSGVQSEAEPK